MGFISDSAGSCLNYLNDFHFHEIMQRSIDLDFSRNAIVLAPHEDDEMLGVGILLQRFCGHVKVVFMTDGAPISGYPMKKRMLPSPIMSREEYADIRKGESVLAANTIGLKESDLAYIGAEDSGLSHVLVDTCEALRGMISSFNPYYIFFPAYEGGHPDHDATAAIAKALSHYDDLREISFFEYALYSSPDGLKIFNEFQDASSGDIRIIAEHDERNIKKEAVSCYKSQLGGLLGNFSIERETIRPARFDRIDGSIPTGKTYLERFYGLDSSVARRSYDSIRKFLESLPRSV